MTYLELHEKMQREGMISGNWKNLLALVESEIFSSPDADRFLKLFTLYFALIADGNVYMSLDRTKLAEKIQKKIDALKVKYQEDAEDEGGENSKLAVHTAELESIFAELSACFSLLPAIASLPVEGEQKLFVVAENRLFTRKHYNAIVKIRKALHERNLFHPNPPISTTFEYKSILDPSRGFKLGEGQKIILEKGVYNNLLITGGPGTGKTTSVFFLLWALLEENLNREIYVAAPSGKAASRMIESIISCEKFVDAALQKSDIFQKIDGLEEHTIHRLLGYDRNNGGFIYNERKPFPVNSIFIIDEASMIDVNLFASLLEAIPEGARVFILGDRNQLPSVGCGAVFGDLLDCVNSENQVRLTESKRFPNGSEIFNLSEAVNHGRSLPVSAADWKDPAGFQVEPEATSDKTPVFYYNDEQVSSKTVDEIAEKWFAYYAPLRKKCVDLHEGDQARFDEILEISEKARILCANNEGARGVNRINKFLLKKHYAAGSGSDAFHAGELLMVTKNIDKLGIYNGDTGVAVKFEGDETLYVMFKKKSDEGSYTAESPKGIHQNAVFRLGKYKFYPLSKISREEITSAFAITIHKSQGSDYQNILVILPKLKGHPLLTRQIVYTAITRTKGNTYILSNQENMEAAEEAEIVRDTGIK